jgi:hypothetical protein
MVDGSAKPAIKVFFCPFCPFASPSRPNGMHEHVQVALPDLLAA